jgi:hypothetical protein
MLTVTSVPSKSMLCLVAAEHSATADSWFMSLSLPYVNVHILYHLRNKQKLRHLTISGIALGSPSRNSLQCTVTNAT